MALCDLYFIQKKCPADNGGTPCIIKLLMSLTYLLCQFFHHHFQNQKEWRNGVC